MSAARGLCVTRGRRKYMKELKGLCVTTGSDRISEEVVRTVGNWVKMNSDASFCPLTGAASAGVVIRDNSGNVLLTAWRTLKRCGSGRKRRQKLAQIVSVWWLNGLDNTCSMWNRIVQNLIHDLNSKEANRSSSAGMVREILRMAALLQTYQKRSKSSSSLFSTSSFRPSAGRGYAFQCSFVCNAASRS
jgi:hypothetical protein